MTYQIQATYEDGVLKFDEVLPLKEHERVLVTIQPQTAHSQPDPTWTLRTRQCYGLIGWTGDPQVLRKIAEDDEYGLEE